jgi:hypothetical protein
MLPETNHEDLPPMRPRPPEMLPAGSSSRHTDGCKITPFARAWSLGLLTTFSPVHHHRADGGSGGVRASVSPSSRRPWGSAHPAPYAPPPLVAQPARWVRDGWRPDPLDAILRE